MPRRETCSRQDEAPRATYRSRTVRSSRRSVPDPYQREPPGADAIVSDRPRLLARPRASGHDRLRCCGTRARSCTCSTRARRSFCAAPEAIAHQLSRLCGRDVHLLVTDTEIASRRRRPVSISVISTNLLTFDADGVVTAGFQSEFADDTPSSRGIASRCNLGNCDSPRPWWRRYGLRCCSRISVAPGLTRAHKPVLISSPSIRSRLRLASDSPKRGIIHSSGLNRRARCFLLELAGTSGLARTG